MYEDEIIEKAIDEIITRRFAVTQQYLEIHEIITIDGIPKIERIDQDEESTAIVYFPLKDEKFHLAVYLDTRPGIAVRAIDTEPYSRVYFRATSETMTLEELVTITSLKPTQSWNKGDKRKFGTGSYKFSSVSFMPNPEPDAFEDKLSKLLDFLEQDKAGIKRLIELANGHVQGAINFHNGNGMLGGPHLDKDMIKRMSELSLEIDFDLYAEGNKFR